MIKIETTRIPNSIKAKNHKDNGIPKEPRKFLQSNLKRLIFHVIFVSVIFICFFHFFTQNAKPLNEGEIIEYNYVDNTKIGTLSQFLMKLSQNHYSISGKTIFDNSFFTKAIYDIYSLSRSLSKNEKNLYSAIYTTAIIINSICFKFDENKTNCELETYLDLTIKNRKNL